MSCILHIYRMYSLVAKNVVLVQCWGKHLKDRDISKDAFIHLLSLIGETPAHYELTQGAPTPKGIYSPLKEFWVQGLQNRISVCTACRMLKQMG